MFCFSLRGAHRFPILKAGSGPGQPSSHWVGPLSPTGEMISPLSLSRVRRGQKGGVVPLVTRSPLLPGGTSPCVRRNFPLFRVRRRGGGWGLGVVSPSRNFPRETRGKGGGETRRSEKKKKKFFSRSGGSTRRETRETGREIIPPPSLSPA